MRGDGSRRRSLILAERWSPRGAREMEHAQKLIVLTDHDPHEVLRREPGSAVHRGVEAGLSLRLIRDEHTARRGEGVAHEPRLTREADPHSPGDAALRRDHKLVDLGIIKAACDRIRAEELFAEARGE